MTLETTHGRRASPPIDLRVVMPAARAGDPDAEQLFVAHTERLVRKRLGFLTARSSLGETVEDVVGQSMANLSTSGLRNFDPLSPLPDGSERSATVVFNQWWKYVNTTATREFRRALIARRRERPVDSLVLDSRPPEQRITTQTYENPDITLELLPRAGTILTPRQLELVKLIAEGKSFEDVSALCGVSPRGVINHVHKARKTIEENLLFPNGLSRLRSFDHYDSRLRQVNKGKVQAVKVLGFWYVRKEWVEPPSASTQELYELNAYGTSADVQLFKILYPDKITSGRRGVLLVRKEDLALLAEIREANRAKRKPAPLPPDPSYATIPELTTLNKEDIQLRSGIKTGRFTDVLRVNGTVFVRRASAVAFLRGE